MGSSWCGSPKENAEGKRKEIGQAGGGVGPVVFPKKVLGKKRVGSSLKVWKGGLRKEAKKYVRKSGEWGEGGWWGAGGGGESTEIRRKGQLNRAVRARGGQRKEGEKKTMYWKRGGVGKCFLERGRPWGGVGRGL